MEQQDHEDWSKVVEWAEHAGLENLKEHHEAANLIAGQASTTLTILLAGVGGSLTYAVSANPRLAGLPMAAAWLCAYLAFLAIMVTLKCLYVGDAPPVHNHPKNLAVRGHALETLREEEIKNIDLRIADLSKRNTERAR
jgi:hypothetical protein